MARASTPIFCTLCKEQIRVQCAAIDSKLDGSRVLLSCGRTIVYDQGSKRIEDVSNDQA